MCGAKTATVGDFLPVLRTAVPLLLQIDRFFFRKYPKLVIAALEAISKTASTKLDSGGMLLNSTRTKVPVYLAIVKVPEQKVPAHIAN